MKKRLIGYGIGLLLAACLYFFENNTGTRIVLCCFLLPALLPPVRRLLFSSDASGCRAKKPVRQAVTLKAFTYPEEEDSGEVRPYRPGDPVKRMHWKLSAKRNEWLIRETAREAVPREIKAETDGMEEEREGRKKKKRLLFCLSALLALLPCLLLIPAVRNSAQALCNRVFEASEQVNAYAYERFPVPPQQPVTLAVLLLSLIAALLLAITLLLGCRVLAFCMLAGCAAFQIYFGLPFPGAVNVLLFAVFALWMAKRPLKRKDALILLSAILAAALAVAVLYPGVDAATEAASERVRDALSRLSGQMTGTLREAPAGENETRHAHTLSLAEGEGEARTHKEFRLETLEEDQISMPRWVDYVKMILLLLAAIALVILPFLPFLWLNARRKKALEARKAFASENVSEAVCAIFRQVIAWLEAMGHGGGNLPYREWTESLPEEMQPGYAQRFSECAALFEEAAYSSHAMGESQREQALSLLEETEQTLYARADRKQRLRLKYGDCLWTEKV